MKVYTREAADAFKKTGNFEKAMDCLLEGAQHYADCISRAIIMPRPDLMLAAVALTNILDVVMDSLDDVEKKTLEDMKKMLGVEAVTMKLPLPVKGDGADG